MIARSWTAEATPARAEEYILHFRQKVVPVLASIEGHRGAYVLKRTVGILKGRLHPELVSPNQHLGPWIAARAGQGTGVAMLAVSATSPIW